MLLDVRRTVAQVAVAARGVLLQELGDHVDRDRRQLLREGDVAVEHLLVRRQVVLRLKGRVAHQQLEEEHAKRPVVDGLAVALLEDELGRE
eukprot:2190287-Prymnesium_polylepis.1